MISKQERIYYIDPVVDHYRTKKATHGLVLRERSPRDWDAPTGKILPLGPAWTNDCTLYHSVDGCYAEVQPVNPRNMNPKHGVIGFLSDDVFVHGEFAHYVNTDRARVVLSEIQRSDAKAFPAMIDRLTVDWYAPAAPWAKDLMPRVGESGEIVRAKVEQAKRHWTLRFVKATALRVAQAKRWNDDIQTMKSEGVEFGTVWWNHFVELTAFVRSERRLSDEELELGGKVSTSIGVHPWVSVDLRLPTDTSFPDPTRELRRDAVMRCLRDYADDAGILGSNIMLGDYSVTPILRSIDA
jgi:hypothetical protein